VDDDEAQAALDRYATELADAVDAAVPGWVEGCVRRVLTAQGIAVTPEVEAEARAAGAAAREAGIPVLRTLLATDIDDQVGTPLAILRGLVRYPTEVLRATGATPVARDEFSTRSFPHDAYDLTPASFADVAPELHEPGLAWGAAKAYVHLARRGAAGRGSSS
jgi:hypothetical protein